MYDAVHCASLSIYLTNFRVHLVKQIIEETYWIYTAYPASNLLVTLLGVRIKIQKHFLPLFIDVQLLSLSDFQCTWIKHWMIANLRGTSSLIHKLGDVRDLKYDVK